MIKIVCIHQDMRNCPFIPDYVIKLYNSLCRNITQEFEFRCYTNEVVKLHNLFYVQKRIIPSNADIPFEAYPLQTDYLWSWWNKLPLFDLIGERILYLDLDTIILDNIDSLLEIEDDFAVLRCPGRKMNCFNGTLISWRPEACHHLWDNFEPGDMHKYKSDQEYFQEHLQIKATWIEDPQIISYKYHVVHLGQDPRKIVYFHGIPKPHQLHLPWIKDHWR